MSLYVAVILMEIAGIKPLHTRIAACDSRDVIVLIPAKKKCHVSLFYWCK